MGNDRLFHAQTNGAVRHQVVSEDIQFVEGVGVTVADRHRAVLRSLLVPRHGLDDSLLLYPALGESSTGLALTGSRRKRQLLLCWSLARGPSRRFGLADGLSVGIFRFGVFRIQGNRTTLALGLARSDKYPAPTKQQALDITQPESTI